MGLVSATNLCLLLSGAHLGNRSIRLGGPYVGNQSLKISRHEVLLNPPTKASDGLTSTLQIRSTDPQDILESETMALIDNTTTEYN